jgi:hypothetical protein
LAACDSGGERHGVSGFGHERAPRRRLAVERRRAVLPAGDGAAQREPSGGAGTIGSQKAKPR